MWFLKPRQTCDLFHVVAMLGVGQGLSHERAHGNGATDLDHLPEQISGDRVRVNILFS